MKKAMFMTPVVTAFDSEGNLDIKSNKNIWEHLIKGGVDGLVIMGSTGEFFSMTMEQKKQLIDEVTAYVNKRTKVYIGTSCMREEDTIELSNYALDAGADAVMIIGPYYFSLSDESIVSYYNKVAKEIKGDIFLYNFPDRNGYDLSPEVTLNLIKENDNIIGYKDTVTEMGHTRKLIINVLDEFPNFTILSGFDENFAHNVISGGSGCIGGLSNVYPELFADWVKAINEQNMIGVSRIQKIVDKMMALYDVGTPFIPILKKAMMLRGVEMEDYCTPPFLKATDKQVEMIRNIIADIEDLDDFKLLEASH
ncbi:dihydrodipicolinate synthase family protein [Tissierellaceae bacterium HCP3S3_D8]